MSSFPCLVRSVSSFGEPRYALGDPNVDRYLEFVAGRCRPNTVRAVAFELKVFFTVVGRDPVAVTAPDVFELLAAQRGDRTVIRLAERGRARGIDVTADDLREVPYEVVLTERVFRRLATGSSPLTDGA